MVANQVDGDLHEPGLDGTIAPKPFAAPVRFEETVLRHAPGGIPVAQGSQCEAEDPRPMELDHGVEIFNL
jgi:hypothetical protein